jgi:hypothetical protein
LFEEGEEKHEESRELEGSIESRIVGNSKENFENCGKFKGNLLENL